MSRPGPYGQSFAAKYLKEGRYAEALTSASEQIEMAPEDPEPFLERAQAYLALERFQEAVDDIVACLKLNEEAQSADEDVIDDTLFTALVDWAKTIAPQDQNRAVALLWRYLEILPKGSKQESLAEWTRWLRGESKILVKDKL
jgi:tetratricopeptide (TPR) repeat protein